MIMMRIMQGFATASRTRKDKFMALIKPPLGLTKAITPEEKQKVNQQITLKMEELEATGLSREQILLSKSQKGLPLKLDPFFQFLKNNTLARQVYLKAGDRFTVQSVIDIALRQDIGADPSYSRVRGPDTTDSKGRADLMHVLPNLREGKFNPQSYQGSFNFSLQKAYDELKPRQPLRHYFTPLDRYEKRQKNLRQIKKYDIHWRNIELLRQFVTRSGNIKSRFKNYLSDGDQRSVRKAIKTARIMGAMPYYGRTPEPLKRNITSLEDEVQELGYQHVNLETGHLFQTRSRSMDSIEVSIEQQNDLDSKYERMTKEGKNFRLWVEGMEKKPDLNTLKAEQYARYLKQEELNRKEQSGNRLKESVDSVLKNISKFKSLKGEEVTKVPVSDSPDCRSDFEKEKAELKRKLEEDPTSIVDRLLRDKLKV